MTAAAIGILELTTACGDTPPAEASGTQTARQIARDHCFTGRARGRTPTSVPCNELGYDVCRFSQVASGQSEGCDIYCEDEGSSSGRPLCTRLRENLMCESGRCKLIDEGGDAAPLEQIYQRDALSLERYNDLTNPMSEASHEQNRIDAERRQAQNDATARSEEDLEQERIEEDRLRQENEARAQEAERELDWSVETKGGDDYASEPSYDEGTAEDYPEPSYDEGTEGETVGEDDL